MDIKNYISKATIGTLSRETIPALIPFGLSVGIESGCEHMVLSVRFPLPATFIA